MLLFLYKDCAWKLEYDSDSGNWLAVSTMEGLTIAFKVKFASKEAPSIRGETFEPKNLLVLISKHRHKC